MYYQNYEDYMREVLGYPIEPKSTYECYNYKPVQSYISPARYSDEIMDLYPEIYKIVNPMVCKLCERNTEPITKELIEQMVDEIYKNLEVEPKITATVNVQVNANLNATTSGQKNKNIANAKNSQTQNSNNNNEFLEGKTNQTQNPTNKKEKHNNTLKDLITILVLNRLLGSGFPNRPPRRQMSQIFMQPTIPAFLPQDGFLQDNYFQYRC